MEHCSRFQAIGLFIATILIILAITVGIALIDGPEPKCLVSHNETYWDPGSTTLIPVGGILVPIIQPAGYKVREVCDQYENSK